MLTALVVAPDGTDRDRTAAFLAAAGWHVRTAPGLPEGLRAARATGPDLVVADLDLPGGDGHALLRRLRLAGCRALLVGTARHVTPGLRSAAAEALAVLPAPVDPAVLLRFLVDRSASAPRDVQDPADIGGSEVDPDLARRLQELYAGALPGRLSAIDAGARAGDTPALARASSTLAGSSAQLGHPRVAELCRAIARDARRGVLAHELVDRLLRLATG